MSSADKAANIVKDETKFLDDVNKENDDIIDDDSDDDDDSVASMNFDEELGYSDLHNQTVEIHEVCGGSKHLNLFRLKHYLPFPVKFPKRIKDFIYGYRLNPGVYMSTGTDHINRIAENQDVKDKSVVDCDTNHSNSHYSEKYSVNYLSATANEDIEDLQDPQPSPIADNETHVNVANLNGVKNDFIQEHVLEPFSMTSRKRV